MVYVKFYQKPSQGSIHMVMQGHANTAPAGADLVCAGATMMAYTLAQAVQFLYEQGKLRKKPKIRILEGKATVIATPAEDAYAETLHTFWVAQCGIHVLAHNYPRNVILDHLTV